MRRLQGARGKGDCQGGRRGRRRGQPAQKQHGSRVHRRIARRDCPGECCYLCRRGQSGLWRYASRRHAWRCCRDSRGRHRRRWHVDGGIRRSFAYGGAKEVERARGGKRAPYAHAPHRVHRVLRAAVLPGHGTHGGCSHSCILPGRRRHAAVCVHAVLAAASGDFRQLQILQRRIQEPVPRRPQHGFAHRAGVYRVDGVRHRDDLRHGRSAGRRRHARGA